MGKAKKTTETRTKAAVGRERRLALALIALLDSHEDVANAADDAATATATSNRTAALDGARSLLSELGYKELESIPRRVDRLNILLREALARGDGGTIAVLGDELVRAQQGLPPSKAKVAGKSRRTPTASTPAAPAAGEASSSES